MRGEEFSVARVLFLCLQVQFLCEGKRGAETVFSTFSSQTAPMERPSVHVLVHVPPHQSRSIHPSSFFSLSPVVSPPLTEKGRRRRRRERGKGPFPFFVSGARPTSSYFRRHIGEGVASPSTPPPPPPPPRLKMGGRGEGLQVRIFLYASVQQDTQCRTSLGPLA